MRVLAIDGGGIRGLIPALVLAELERRSERRVHQLFDLIAGTSTGGILACALCAPDPLPAAEIAAIYEEEGPRIFDRSPGQVLTSAFGLLGEKYDDEALNRALARFLGQKRLRETRPPLLVPAYDTALPGPYFFKTSKAVDQGEDFALSVVARATSAAPTYFEPLAVNGRALVDGGVFAGNPAMCALAEVLKETDRADVRLVSLGTGERTRKRSFDQIKNWGIARWARPILNIVFDGVSDAVHYQLDHLLDDYWRFQIELTGGASDDLDDAGERNLRRLRELGGELIRDHSAELDAVVAAVRR